MRTVRRSVVALDDTVLLLCYALCWWLALFAPSQNQLGLATVGRVLSAVAVTVVAILWVSRPMFRLGWRLRDVWIIVLVGLAAIKTNHSPIRHLAGLDLLQTLELAALYVVAAYLCARRPQALLAATVLLLAATAALAWRYRAPVFPMLDPVRLASIAALMLLAVIPWMVVGPLRAWRRWYHWLVLAAAVLLAGFDAAGSVLAGGNRIDSLFASLSAETWQVIDAILKQSWALGCGPGHYEWMFRATMPETLAGHVAALPGALLLLVERGALGFAAMFAFAAAMLWRFRPGPWADQHTTVLDLARPLRYVAAYVFLLSLATPALRAPIGPVILWSLFGILRAFSSQQRPAAVGLVAEESGQENVRSVVLTPALRWRRVFLFTGVLLAGIGLMLFHLRPWLGMVYRMRPAGIQLHETAYLQRVELAREIWPYDPRTHEMEAVHYRAKANAGLPLTPRDIGAATAAYVRMIQANPYNGFSHNTLARWYIVQGKIEKAIEACRRGLAYCPASFELQYLLAGCYRKLNKLPAAREAYLRAWRMQPRSRLVLLSLADLAARMGKPQESRRYLLRARQIAPGDATIRTRLEVLRNGGIPKKMKTDQQATTSPAAGATTDSARVAPGP